MCRDLQGGRHDRIGHRPRGGHHRLWGHRAERQKNTLIQYGVITTPPGIPLSNRLLQISNDMEELIRTFHPDEMAVEELFFTKNITTGIAVAHGRGVILLAAEKLGGSHLRVHPHASEAGGWWATGVRTSGR